jgi:hypothetical protein
MPPLLLLPAVCAISRACCRPNVKQQQQFACMHAFDQHLSLPCRCTTPRPPSPPCLQVRKTFEDLYAEALRMNAGNPSLAPYSQVVRKQILTTAHSGAAAGEVVALPAGKDAAAAAAAGEHDPSSVLAAAYEAESSSSSITSSSRPWGSGGQQRSPRPGLGQRGSGGLRSHPIGSLLDLACMADAPDPSPLPAARSGGGGSASERTWRSRLYCLLQRLWLASNAARGDAQHELEEMAVLV